MTGEVLGTRRDTGGLNAIGPCGCVSGDSDGIRPEAPNADHRVVRVGVDVGIGRERQVDPDARQLLADLVSNRVSGIDVVDASEYGVAGEWRTVVLMHPRDVAAFFVDRNDCLRVRVVDRRRQRGDLGR